MDRLESLGSQISQLTMYDIKSYYNQVREKFVEQVMGMLDAL